MQLKLMIPMLNVSNIRHSLEFYQRALGFEVVSDPAAVDQWQWATIRSGETEIMLSQTESAGQLKSGIDPQQCTDWPTIFYFYPDDVAALYQHICAEGYQPTDLVDTHYGMREFSLQDPDGHMLSFGEALNRA
ncbi:VOC family protein [Aliagarivorans taiwanensis]|uniref:VOC family protein n=1 Tax=Aliagarivorans taiwanensis TaxID=561966 RepID=UPI0003F4F946|nr:VOC family protein [Aliagarivorans taiwanensis]